ncbi:MAG TPA: hypothetical protein EYQ22_03560 [Gammaproteobacteria bacterium]|nr:hypothetical protein [Gammaproteobacteria bacterium]HIK69706.1 hypothetical protein [Pseudomonadales bacterium]|tara:strand:+ start:316 stop:699 length:384 start_codon:yes stop_codon:yes gene_type:complete
MKSIILKTILSFTLFALAASASAAEARVINLWECTVNESKTMDDVHAANGKWVKYVNAQIDGGDIHSYVLTPIVGMADTFKYVDSFPSLTSWTTLDEIDNDEMKAIEKGLNEAASCASNTLHRSKAS